MSSSGPRISHTIRRVGFTIQFDRLEIAVTFHPTDIDRTFAGIINGLRSYGDDITGDDPGSVNERNNLNKQLTKIYEAWTVEVASKKISDVEELASYINAVIKKKWKDEEGNCYCALDIDDHVRTFNMDSNDFYDIVFRVGSTTISPTNKKVFSLDKVKNVVRFIEAFITEERRMYTRVAFINDVIYVDLHNALWQAIKIDADGWSLVENPLIFRRPVNSPEKYEMALPSRNYDPNRRYILELIDRTSIQYKYQKSIVEKYFFTLFLDDIPHPMLLPFGPKGSGKSTLMKIIKYFVDPTKKLDGLLTMYEQDPKDRFVAIYKNYLTYWDNVSMITYEQMDEACQWVTGIEKQMRKYYTNDEMKVYAGKRALGINGVNIPVSKSDIIDRSLILEMARVDKLMGEDGKYVKILTEKELMFTLTNTQSEIMGYIFDVLSRALKLYKEKAGEITIVHRLSDFVVWGEIFARVLGDKENQFLDDWLMNSETQALSVVSNDSFASLFVRYVYHVRGELEFHLEPLIMLKELKMFAEEMGIDWHTDRQMPRNEVWLSRRLNEIDSDLSIYGLTVIRGKEDDARVIRVIKDPKRYQVYEEKRKLREEKESKAREERMKESQQTELKSVIDYLRKYTDNHPGAKMPPTIIQNLLTSNVLSDAGRSHEMVQTLITLGILKIDNDGNASFNPEALSGNIEGNNEN